MSEYFLEKVGGGVHLKSGYYILFWNILSKHLTSGVFKTVVYFLQNTLRCLIGFFLMRFGF